MQPATYNKPNFVLNNGTCKNGRVRMRYLEIIVPCKKGLNNKKTCLSCERIYSTTRYNEYSIRQAKEIELPVVVDVIMEAHKKKYEDHKIFEKLLGAYGQCLREKKQARLEHRQFRQWKEINKMKVKLAQIRGQPVDWSGTYETPQERRQVMLWMQKRKFVVIVAVRLRDPCERQNMVNNYIEQQLSVPTVSTQQIHQSRSPQNNGGGSNNEIHQQQEVQQQQQIKVPPKNILATQSDLQIAQNQKQRQYGENIGGTQFSQSNISSVQLGQSTEISSQVLVDDTCFDNGGSVQTQNVGQIQIGDSKQINTQNQQNGCDNSDEQSQDLIYFDQQYLDQYWKYEIVGSATISLSRVEASLPPPFPSNKEFRMYITNVSVKDGWRRLGVATELMKYAEIVGFRWGEGSCWLHVDDDNPGARLLYDKLGYKVVASDPWWKLTNRRTLMMKPLNKNDTLNAPPSTSLIQGVEGYKDEKGVFVWSAKIQTESGHTERQDS